MDDAEEIAEQLGVSRPMVKSIGEGAAALPRAVGTGGVGLRCLRAETSKSMRSLEWLVELRAGDIDAAAASGWTHGFVLRQSISARISSLFHLEDGAIPVGS